MACRTLQAGACPHLAVVLVAALVGVHATGAAESWERVVRFPAERSVGTIYWRPPLQGSYAGTLWSDDWRRLGEARGEVPVPVDADVRLDPGSAVSEDLAFLADLRPDDVQALNLGRTAVRDAGLKHVAHLTGLKLLDLSSTRITDEGVRQLTPLVHLRDLNLDAFGVDQEGFGVGDGGLRAIALAKWVELERISLRR